MTAKRLSISKTRAMSVTYKILSDTCINDFERHVGWFEYVWPREWSS